MASEKSSWLVGYLEDKTCYAIVFSFFPFLIQKALVAFEHSSDPILIEASQCFFFFLSFVIHSDFPVAFVELFQLLKVVAFL